MTSGPIRAVFLIDGVRHSAEEFRRLNLQPNDIESVVAQKCVDFCEQPSLVIIRLKPVRQ